MKGVVAPFINLAGKWNLLSTHMWERKLFKLCGQLSLDKTAAKKKKKVFITADASLFRQTIPPWIVLDGIQLRVRAEH